MGGHTRHFKGRFMRAWVMVAACLFGVGLTARATGEEPAKPRFDIPVWHADTEWEVDGNFAGCNAPGFLVGPRRESQPFAGPPDLLWRVSHSTMHSYQNRDSSSISTMAHPSDPRGKPRIAAASTAK